jgi:hypothetical protein
MNFESYPHLVLDEYYSAYQDRSVVLDSGYSKQFNPGGAMVNGTIVMNGRIIGGWKRTIGDGTVTITLRVFEKVTGQQQAINAAAKRYGKFLGLPVLFRRTPSLEHFHK